MTDELAPISVLIAELLAKGLSPGDALDIARKVEGALHPRVAIGRGDDAARRERERLKKARQRDRKRNGVPGGQVGTGVAAISSLKEDNSQKDGKKKEIAFAPPVPPVPGDKPKRSTGTRIPEDWKPTAADVEYGGSKLNLRPEQVMALGEDMRLWAVANANRAVARKENWTLTFYGWMRREAPKIVRQQGGLNAAPQGTRSGFNAIAGRLRHGAASDDQLPFGQPPAGPQHPDRR